jgi:hypothetical protein
MSTFEAENEGLASLVFTSLRHEPKGSHSSQLSTKKSNVNIGLL